MNAPTEFLHTQIETPTLIVDVGCNRKLHEPRYLPLVRVGLAKLLGIDSNEEACLRLHA
jgi:hypothetical protein